MKTYLTVLALALAASVAVADLAQYLAIAMPQEAYTTGIQAKLDSAIQRFTVFTNSTDSCGGWSLWCQTNNPTKIWMVTALATDHLRVHKLDQLDDAKLADLKTRLADARIRILFCDDVSETCASYGLRMVGNLSVVTNSP